MEGGRALAYETVALLLGVSYCGAESGELPLIFAFEGFLGLLGRIDETVHSIALHLSVGHVHQVRGSGPRPLVPRFRALRSRTRLRTPRPAPCPLPHRSLPPQPLTPTQCRPAHRPRKAHRCPLRGRGG